MALKVTHFFEKETVFNVTFPQVLMCCMVVSLIRLIIIHLVSTEALPFLNELSNFSKMHKKKKYLEVFSNVRY